MSERKILVCDACGCEAGTRSIRALSKGEFIMIAVTLVFAIGKPDQHICHICYRRGCWTFV